MLGSLEILWDSEKLAVPRGPKVRQLLSLLILQPGSVVSHGSIVDELWGKEPPKTALSTVRTHVYHLRQILHQEIGERIPATLIDTCSTGYVLRALPEQVDTQNFMLLARQGEAALSSGNLVEGSHLLKKALDLWRGGALSDITSGSVLTQHVQHLEELYIRILQLRIGADMQLGRHSHVAAELKRLVIRHPLNEWLHGQLITALYHSGRRGDALRAYQELRKILREELGLDPSPELQLVHQEILSNSGICSMNFLPGILGDITGEPFRRAS
ncbi:AfsR/SARP family transcriptional regulator [Streptomyces sp. DSM 40750]|uniref:AfsR/SARP family transcriptional regulator n=1 Tax=Streptomyces sp. DSM 40750 TaxID=2801030 RepID=UPI00214AB89E|nr:AfsR/SARP family transcriptional regulator [Streptomyces sp. DSM 40750]UUU28021.1 AfsR/SARP family transcriptional regulator [Streptomyces sp. DSM 40750]